MCQLFPRRIRVIVATLRDLLLLLPAALLLCFAWWQRHTERCVRNLRRRFVYVPTHTRTGVLLLHGSGFNKTQWCLGQTWLRTLLQSSSRSGDEYEVHSIDYAGLVSNKHSDGIDTYATHTVRKQLIELARTRNIQRWVLVGHSMGGLIAAFYAEEHSRYDDIIVPKVVTIASPWKGSPLLTRLAIFHGGTNNLPVRYQQMLPNSLFLERLVARVLSSQRTYETLGSEVDLMVPDTCWSLPNNFAHITNHVGYKWVGHYAIVTCYSIWLQVANAIATA